MFDPTEIFIGEARRLAKKNDVIGIGLNQVARAFNRRQQTVCILDVIIRPLKDDTAAQAFVVQREKGQRHRCG